MRKCAPNTLIKEHFTVHFLCQKNNYINRVIQLGRSRPYWN